MDVYVTCFSDGVNRVPGLSLRVWAYVMDRALFYLLLGLFLYSLSDLTFGLMSEPRTCGFGPINNNNTRPQNCKDGVTFKIKFEKISDAH